MKGQKINKKMNVGVIVLQTTINMAVFAIEARSIWLDEILGFQYVQSYSKMSRNKSNLSGIIDKPISATYTRLYVGSIEPGWNGKLGEKI